MRKSMFLVFMLLVAVGIPGTARAGRDTFWLNLGAGAGTVDKGSTLLINISYQSGRHLFTLRTVSTGAAMFEKGKNMYDTGLLYGRAFGSPSLHLSAGLGISVAGGHIDRGGGIDLFSGSSEEDEDIGPTVGLPVDIQLFWRPLPFIGIGIYGFCDLNPEESFAGFALCLQVGKLK